MSQGQPARVSDALQFNVAQLLKQPTGARRTYNIDAEVFSLDENLVLVDRLRGQVRLLRVGSGVLATGALHTAMKLTCTRCLGEFRLRVSFDIEEEFQPTIDVTTGASLEKELNQDPATLIDEHHILDLTEVVRQDLWLNLPTSPACRPDCRGLCPHCGQNLNRGSCDCKVHTIDARWAPLLADASRERE
jgi:DUF177 domain-containing protein